MKRMVGYGLTIAGLIVLPPLMMAGLIGWADMSVAGSDGAITAGLVLLVSIVLWFVCLFGLLMMAWESGQRRQRDRRSKEQR